MTKIGSLLAALALFSGICPAFASSEHDIPGVDFSGAWRLDGSESASDRLIVRRGELILLAGKKTVHGRLVPVKDNQYRYVINFVNNRSEGRVEKVDLRLDKDKLMFKREGEPVASYSRLDDKTADMAVQRKGFEFKVPAGWVSNVELLAGKRGKKPADYEMDQLVHYYEAGMPQPTENLTIQLLRVPMAAMMKKVSKTLENPAISSRRESLQTGSRKGYAYVNSTPVGNQRVTAKVYILPWDKTHTLTLAASTLLPRFPPDLDRKCRAVLSSVK